MTNKIQPYAILPYNSICIGTYCDKRFTEGKTLPYLKISLCPDCFNKIKNTPKKKFMRLDAECNEVIQMCFKKIQDRGYRI